MSPFSGTVVDSTSTGKGGNIIKIRDDESGKELLIAHMASLSGLRPGDRIERMDVIGYTGATGNATGNTVHIQLNDEEEDILSFLGIGE